MCQKHEQCRATRSAVRKWMAERIADHTDAKTGEVNCTTLAEAAAHHFDHEEWLDDSTSQVWDLAISAAEQSGDRR